MNTFSPTEAIKFGWKTFKTNPGFCIGMLFILIITSIILNAIFPSPKIDSNNTQDISSILATSTLTSFISGTISMVVTLGVTKALLIFVETGKGNYVDTLIPLKQTKILINWFLAFTLIYPVGAILFAGFWLGFLGSIFGGVNGGILLIIPIVIILIVAYLIIRLGLFTYFIVDKAAGPIQSFKLSWRATKGNVINLIFLGLLSGLVALAGALALLVGLLVAIPVVMIAGIYAYRELSKDGVVNAPTTPNTPVAPATETPPVVSAT